MLIRESANAGVQYEWDMARPFFRTSDRTVSKKFTLMHVIGWMVDIACWVAMRYSQGSIPSFLAGCAVPVPPMGPRAREVTAWYSVEDATGWLREVVSVTFDHIRSSKRDRDGNPPQARLAGTGAGCRWR